LIDNVHKILAMPLHEVAVLVPNAVVAFDVAIPCQVLAFATMGDGEVRYRVRTCGVSGGPVQTANGFEITPDAPPEAALRADTVLVPGTADNGLSVDAELGELIAEVAEGGARIASICTGAFALAAAGVLDGRRATTHWAHAGRLATEYPQIDVDPDALYVEDGPAFTSAGLAAGLDLCLHLVRRDYGFGVANLAARGMVVPAHRTGGQAQFIERPVPPLEGSELDDTRAWILDHLDESLTLERMARHAHMSPRSFSRHFVAETGSSPMRWVLDQRVRAAQDLLETTNFDVESIATECGFGSATSLRQHFRRITSTTPLAYRRTFNDTAARGDGRRDRSHTPLPGGRV
jgi:AraC family transcriptional regulator, transcriptional activator FtrA